MSQTETINKLNPDNDNASIPIEVRDPKENHHFLNKNNRAKVVPISIDLDLTVDKNTSILSPSGRFRSIAEKLSSFKSEKMITQNNTRDTFIKKVFGMLSLQSVIALIFIGIVMAIEDLKLKIRVSHSLAIVCLVLLLALGLFLLLFKNIAKRKPAKYILFTLFIVFMPLISAYTSSLSKNPFVISVLFIFAGVNLCLYFYAMISKDNFNTKKAFLVSFAGCSVSFAISLSFTFIIYQETIYVFICIIPFVWFAIYDVQLIAGGRLTEFTYDDYLISSLIVYVEIVGIFFYIIYVVKTAKGN
ncbi:hypothetical protein SteCoe_21620 [Stentor coeruleus]|uniref:Uncharacterized protein n=1 Tax=Stentor coeruleus TaxID=5963 RepID=A0A1R2BP52_9CILI|nr:hypothetical protein SteCoe_21620 [Stentor coeruleus]